MQVLLQLVVRPDNQVRRCCMMISIETASVYFFWSSCFRLFIYEVVEVLAQEERLISVSSADPSER
jgi:hypothetical protein